MGKLAALIRKFVAETPAGPEAKKAVQQVAATALKHGAVSVRVALDTSTVKACFSLKNEFVTTVEISVAPLAFMAEVLTNSRFDQEESARLLASAEISVTSVTVACDVSVGIQSGDLLTNDGISQIGKPGTFIELRNFSVVREPLLSDEEFNDSSARTNSAPVSGTGAFVTSSSEPSSKMSNEHDELRLRDEADLGKRMRDNRLLLVIDDDADQRAILRRVFELEGYDVLLAADGVDGVLSANKEKPDVIIVDFMMPDFDGCETIKRLRKEPATHKIPIVALTAYPDSEVECRLLDAGASDFCSKAISKKVLLKRIERLL